MVVKKSRLSKAYMDLLIRNQAYANVTMDDNFEPPTSDSVNDNDSSEDVPVSNWVNNTQDYQEENEETQPKQTYSDDIFENCDIIVVKDISDFKTPDSCMMNNNESDIKISQEEEVDSVMFNDKEPVEISNNIEDELEEIPLEEDKEEYSEKIDKIEEEKTEIREPCFISEREYLLGSLRQQKMQDLKDKIMKPPPVSPRRRKLFSKNNNVYVPSPSHQKLMNIINEEKTKHKEMINLLSNEAFAFSRKPPDSNLKSKAKSCYKYPRTVKEPAIKQSVAYDNRMSSLTRIVRNKRLDEYLRNVDDLLDKSKEPVPIRPPRKRSSKLNQKRPRRGKKTSSNFLPSSAMIKKKILSVIHEADEDEDNVPIRPVRLYKSRDADTVTGALQLLVSHQPNIAFIALGKYRVANKISICRKLSFLFQVSIYPQFVPNKLGHSNFDDSVFIYSSRKDQAAALISLVNTG